MQQYKRVKSFGAYLPPGETIVDFRYSLFIYETYIMLFFLSFTKSNCNVLICVDFRFNLLPHKWHFCAANLTIPIEIIDGSKINEVPILSDEIQEQIEYAIKNANKDRYEETQSKYRKLKDTSFVLSALALSMFLI